jgi:hypothetical protein
MGEMILTPGFLCFQTCSRPLNLIGKGEGSWEVAETPRSQEAVDMLLS